MPSTGKQGQATSAPPSLGQGSARTAPSVTGRTCAEFLLSAISCHQTSAGKQGLPSTRWKTYNEAVTSSEGGCGRGPPSQKLPTQDRQQIARQTRQTTRQAPGSCGYKTPPGASPVRKELRRTHPGVKTLLGPIPVHRKPQNVQIQAGRRLHQHHIHVRQRRVAARDLDDTTRQRHAPLRCCR